MNAVIDMNNAARFARSTVSVTAPAPEGLDYPEGTLITFSMGISSFARLGVDGLLVAYDLENNRYTVVTAGERTDMDGEREPCLVDAANGSVLVTRDDIGRGRWYAHHVQAIENFDGM